MKMNRIIYYVSAFLFIFSIISCKTKELPFSILNLNKTQGLTDYSSIYTLPKTVIRVNVKAERETYIKGPYYQYAETYLGLTDVIKEDRSKWRISFVDFDTYPIADTNNYYVIKANDPNLLLRFGTNKFGFLESINADGQENTMTQETNGIYGTKLVPSGILESHQNQIVSFDEVSIPKEILSKNSTSDRAAALANKILMLRDDRAAILVGDGYTQALPSGETMKTMISEIDKTLESYLVMFKGKVVKETYSYTFKYVPEEPRKTTQSILFRFSDQNGIVDNSDISGIPVRLEIESYQNLKQLEQLIKRQFYMDNVAGKKESDKALYYRIPEMGIVRLLKNDQLLQEEKIQIAQFGSVQSLPSKYLEGKYSVLLYPELGAIKSISQNKNYVNELLGKKKK